MNSKLPKLLMAAGILMAVTAQAAPADLVSVTPKGDQQFAVIHTGMTQEEVRAALGAPPTTTENSRTAETLWIYPFTDTWGYRSEYDVEFKDGVVTETFSERTQG